MTTNANMKYAHQGADVFFTVDPPEIKDRIDNGFYTVEFHPERGPYLHRIVPFELPGKLYGDLQDRADRIVTTYDSRKKNTTGILLLGEKGSGKTLLGKKVALDVHERFDQPVLVINKPISGDALGQIIQNLGRPVTLFLDEFEKTYKEDHQEALLTVLDGAYEGRILAILTANTKDRVVSPLVDRPGRVFYSITYTGLDFRFVSEYAEERLEDKSRLPEVQRLAAMTDLNFDQLQALIEEMNRFDETATEAIQFLNISLDNDEKAYSLKAVKLNGVALTRDQVVTRTLYLSPLDHTGKRNVEPVPDLKKPTGRRSKDPSHRAQLRRAATEIFASEDNDADDVLVVVRIPNAEGFTNATLIGDDHVKFGDDTTLYSRWREVHRDVSDACENSNFKLSYRDFREKPDNVPELRPSVLRLLGGTSELRMDGTTVLLSGENKAGDQIELVLERGASFNRKAF